MKKMWLVALIVLTTSLSTYADDTSSGCGYGWTVTKNKTLLGSSIRSSVNAVASNTIAMTMGTSGCEKHEIVIKDREQEYFTEINYENIVAEMAQGQGEYLTTFANVLGCRNVEAFSNTAQANLVDLVAHDAISMLNNVRSNKNIQSACL